MEKENKEKKKFIIVIIIAILLIIIGVLSYFLFFGNRLTINTNGGNIVKQIEIKDDEIVTLPVIEKDGYKVVAYINENKKMVKPGTKINTKTQITPVFVKQDTETIKVTYYDGENVIDEIELGKGMELILPEDPVKEGFVFAGWQFDNGMILIGNPNLQVNVILKAIWISFDKEMIMVKIASSDNHETIIASYKQEKGTKITLPSPTKKEGMVFENWQDTNGNIINNDMVVNNDITIFATFAKYTCPDNCTVNSDGKTCTKTETTNKISKQGCPSGAFLYYGKCITLKGADSASLRQCDGDMSGKEVYYNNYCAKVVSKVTITTCPDGYKQDGETCKKDTIINCTKID